MKRSQRLRKAIWQHAGITIACLLWAVPSAMLAIVLNQDGAQMLQSGAVCSAIILTVFAIRNASEAVRHARLLAMWEAK